MKRKKHRRYSDYKLIRKRTAAVLRGTHDTSASSKMKTEMPVAVQTEPAEPSTLPSRSPRLEYRRRTAKNMGSRLLGLTK